jgi:hypothetical protein
MSKVLENRKSSFSLASKKEIELTHLLSLAYVRHNLNQTLISITYTNAPFPAIPPPLRFTTGSLWTLHAKMSATLTF